MNVSGFLTADVGQIPAVIAVVPGEQRGQYRASGMSTRQPAGMSAPHCSQ